MPNKGPIDIQWNVKEFNGALMQYVDEVETDTATAVRDVTFLAEGNIKGETPVLTGFLRGSIHGRMLSRLIGLIATKTGYAPHVELGTAKMKGRHMFKRGMKKTQGALIARIQASMRRRA